MDHEDFDHAWRALSEDIFTGMYEWRLQHPKATLREIETAIDERLAPLRTKMLQDAALATPAANWADAPPAEQPVCPQCQTALTARGKQSRSLQAHGGRDIVLERTYGVCPACGTGLFPPR